VLYISASPCQSQTVKETDNDDRRLAKCDGATSKRTTCCPDPSHDWQTVQKLLSVKGDQTCEKSGNRKDAHEPAGFDCAHMKPCPALQLLRQHGDALGHCMGLRILSVQECLTQSD
jgi:hypothetical protein